MNGLNKRFRAMVGRVLIFATNHPALFEEDSVEKRLIDALAAAVAKLDALLGIQLMGRGDGRVSTNLRVQARKGLRSQLEAVARAAAGVGLNQFWAPADKSDKSLIEVARIFAERAEPVKADLIKGNLPSDFIDRLNTASSHLRKVIADQVTRESELLAATNGIEAARKDAIAALERLDLLIENKLVTDAALSAAWWSARHVERYGKSRSRKTAADDNGQAPVSSAA